MRGLLHTVKTLVASTTAADPDHAQNPGWSATIPPNRRSTGTHRATPHPAAIPATRQRPQPADATATQMAGLASQAADSTHQSGSPGSHATIARQPSWK